ncbi:MAG TPA: hypothetical protein PKL24_25655 [Polyangiaceae bacterium]|jgi:hypothetical protein|nr:hypothetical protein [Polyangiaceae bacterium]HOH03806.1 hypothetical protein [Polyangiaceae bacterium]HPK96224.1 hypothetical protein [Polyangiaceae bacterium]
MNPSFSEPEYRNSFDTLKPRLLDIPEADLINPTVRIRESSHLVLGIAEVANGPTWRPRFEKLAQSGEWNITYLDDLAPAARTLWYIRHRLDQIAATASSAKLPPDLVQSATAMRTRMRKVCEFHFSDDPSLEPKLAYLRQGFGYDDLADDLFGYAAIYQEHGSVVETTPKFYLASDKTDAIQLAERMLSTLGYRGTKETAEWVSLQSRGFTFLKRAYDEVRAAG